jgi:hypothetical protein
MPDQSPPIPIDRKAVLDLYFLEHRAKLLDLAAFLDRYDRAEGAGDFRIDAFRDAAKVLLEGEPGRARRVQEAFSDRTDEPIPVAPGKGACGAPPPTGHTPDAEASDPSSGGAN